MSFPFKEYDKDIQRLEDELTSLMRQRLDGDDSEALRRRISCLTVRIESMRCQVREALRRKDNRNNYFESDIRIMV